VRPAEDPESQTFLKIGPLVVNKIDGAKKGDSEFFAISKFDGNSCFVDQLVNFLGEFAGRPVEHIINLVDTAPDFAHDSVGGLTEGSPVARSSGQQILGGKKRTIGKTSLIITVLIFEAEKILEFANPS